jgi:hypothetical protein
VVVGLALAGCSSKRETGTVLEVYGDPGSTRVEVSIDSCNQNPEVEVHETTTEVSLDVTVDEAGSSGDDCLDNVTVTLAESLGDRRVITNGEHIAVTPAEEP